MKYHGKDTSMWDGWYLPIGDTLHAFHLQLPEGESELELTERQKIGHIISHDLLHWEHCPGILPPLLRDEEPDDYHQKFTGCAVQNGETTFLYYTMRDKTDGSQRIGLAECRDGIHFERYPQNPVLEPDSRILLGYENRAQYDFGCVNCRDLSILYQPEEGLYYGYFAAAADVGRESPVGVIAVAVSRDLIHWEDQSIVFVPRQNGVIEVPDVFYEDGQYYLTMLCGSQYTGRSGTPDEYVCNATVYATADNPRGPFVEPEENLLIGGIRRSGFTCRTFLWKGERYLLYVDRSPGYWTLSLPKRIRAENGRLFAERAELLDNLRTKCLAGNGEMPELLPAQTTFAWNTRGGEFWRQPDGFSVKTNPMDYQAAYFDCCSRNMELQTQICADAVGAGIAFQIETEEGSVPWFLSLEPDRGRVILLKEFDFCYHAARTVPLERGREYLLDVIWIDGVIEVYLDNRLWLQCALDRCGKVRPGLFCDCGTAEFAALKIDALEE